VITPTVRTTSPANWRWKRSMKVPSPRIPRPTTPRPITEPPAKAISSALPRLVRAAWVVRTFARVATRMPMKPAAAEQSAPPTKARAISGEEPGCRAPLQPSSSATASTKTERTRYSARRKAIAPSWMALAIRIICALPASCRVTQAVRRKV